MSNQTPSPLAMPASWDAVVDGYTTDNVPFFSLFAHDALALAGTPAGAAILDVACGPGTLALIAAGDARHVAALDFSEQMIGSLRRRAAHQGVTNVELIHADGQSLPFEDASFDRAFSMFGLMFFPDRAAGLREMHRVLRPGGRATISSWHPLEHVAILDEMMSALRSLVPALPPGGNLPMSDAAEIRHEMLAAGFDQVDVHVSEHTQTYASVEEFWASAKRSSAPVGLLKRNLDVDTWERVDSGVVPVLERRFGRGPIDAAWRAHIAVGPRA